MKKTVLFCCLSFVVNCFITAQIIIISPSSVEKNNQRVTFTFSSGSNAVFYQGSPTAYQGSSTVNQGTPTIRYIPSDVVLRFYKETFSQGTNTQGTPTLYQGTPTSKTEMFLNPTSVTFVNSHQIQAAFDISTYLPQGAWDVLFGVRESPNGYYMNTYRDVNGKLHYLDFNNYYQPGGITMLDGSTNSNIPIFGKITNTTEIGIYPNPLLSELHVTLGEKIVYAQYQIVGANGIIIKTGSLYDTESIIDLYDLSSGVYFVKIFDNNSILKTSEILKK